jgi:hypothetical protein
MHRKLDPGDWPYSPSTLFRVRTYIYTILSLVVSFPHKTTTLAAVREEEKRDLVH